MFSLGKLLVLILIVGGVWYGFKYVNRLQYQRETKAAARDRVARRESEQRRAGSEAADMQLCPACKAYVPAKGATNCGRPDCPY